MCLSKFVSWEIFFGNIDYRDIDVSFFKEKYPFNFVITCDNNINFEPRKKSFFDDQTIHQIQDEWTYFILRKEKSKNKDIDICVFDDYEAFFFFKNEMDAIMARLML
jgi:hypothetical protein